MFTVSPLVLSFSQVVALPVQFSTSNINGLVKEEASREDTQHVDDALEVVEVRVNTVRDASVLHLDGHSGTVLDDGLVHLADGSSGERVKVDLLEVLLPIVTVFTNKVFGDLLKGHNVSF